MKALSGKGRGGKAEWRISRREFARKLAYLGGGCALLASSGSIALSLLSSKVLAGDNVDACLSGYCGRYIYGKKLPYKNVARYWQKIDSGTVQCFLCPYNCILKNGQRCICNAKEPNNAVLYDMVYGYVATLHIDPIEKFPIFHFLPGEKVLTLGTAGCALNCKYCQNWQLSQAIPEDTKNYLFQPKDIIKVAKSEKLSAVGFSYTEPMTFYEYTYDICEQAKQNGLCTFVATGGFINPKPLRDIAPLIDAICITLKGFSDKFYKDYIAKGKNVKLKHILTTLETAKSSGMHTEVVTLLLPGINDGESEIAWGARWLKENLGADTPWHFLKFFPRYLMRNLPPTPHTILDRAREIAMAEGLKFVYTGNIPGHRGNNTYCPNCQQLLIQRVGFEVIKNRLNSSRCSNCGTKIAGNFSRITLTKS